MLDKLIAEGESLENLAVDGEYVGKMISGVEFETWAAKVILFLERNHANSSLTEKAIKVNKNLGTNSYDNYEFLLGTIKAAKEFADEEAKFQDSVLKLNF
ncbi:hypothetical protein PAALTS15_13597 [Paenibacillus alvei TS-15]|uniref:Uncharacterized protein n=1 Tax=Paenibacillus alvei TS-15 TaxID=1117108 RepID=S9SLN0_PAEAL|nr:hypothetical protein [Paenibacillus alvei]EPY06642.1 hypothetical protein PAALTS15_13597 [Paenibacillus alvei TS-15]